MKLLVSALIATTALSMPALAADFMATPDPLILSDVRVSNWTGFYAGVFGGVAFNTDEPGVIEIDEDLDGDFDEPLVLSDDGTINTLGEAFGDNFTGSNDAGFVGGIEAGYDMQFDNFVLGGVVDIASVDYSEKQQAFSSTPASYSEERELNYLATIRARAGLLVTDDVLAYVHGGLAVGDVEYQFVTNSPASSTSSGGDDMSFGYQVGAGVQAKVTENVSFGIEYAYTNLGDSDFNTRFDSGPFVVANPDGADLRGEDRTFDFHTVKASVKYHF